VVIAGRADGFGFEHVELEVTTNLPDLCVDIRMDFKGEAEQGDRHLESVCV